MQPRHKQNPLVSYVCMNSHLLAWNWVRPCTLLQCDYPICACRHAVAIAAFLAEALTAVVRRPHEYWLLGQACLTAVPVQQGLHQAHR